MSRQIHIYQISSQYLKRQLRKVWKTNFFKRIITQVKVVQMWKKSNLIRLLCQDKFSYQISSQYLKGRLRRVKNPSGQTLSGQTPSGLTDKTDEQMARLTADRRQKTYSHSGFTDRGLKVVSKDFIFPSLTPHEFFHK